LTLRDEFRFRQILFKLTALKERRRTWDGGGCRRQDGQSVEKLGLEQGRFSPWLV
jgi:hypothetical protein